MKDSEFIELLNLYLDHEISPADSARLEAEVLGNPKRREIYRDYCRMQKACKMLAQEFQAEAAPAPLADGKVVAFEVPQQRTVARHRGFYVAGGFAAAAACAAFIFVAGNRPTDESQFGSPDALVQTANGSANGTALVSAPVETTASRSIPQTVSIPEAREVQPGLVEALTLAGKSTTPANSLLTSADQNASQFAWMHTLQLEPVQRVSIEEFRFEGNSPLRRDGRPYQGPRTPQNGQMEWNAIRYQK